MFRDLFRFFIVFSIVVLLTYFLHSWIIDFFSFESSNRIRNLSYIFNTIAVFVLIAGILIAKNKFKDQLGFIFLAGSFIKLGIFVALTKWNGMEMNKSIFLDFFIPYVICMIFEVYYISKILKTIN